jgi:hypothetical protein
MHLIKYYFNLKEENKFIKSSPIVFHTFCAPAGREVHRWVFKSKVTTQSTLTRNLNTIHITFGAQLVRRILCGFLGRAAIHPILPSISIRARVFN